MDRDKPSPLRNGRRRASPRISDRRPRPPAQDSWRYSGCPYHQSADLLEGVPCAALPGQELVSSVRPLASRWVAEEGGTSGGPAGFDGVDQHPGGLNLVRTDEACRVAKHAVVQKVFVGVDRASLKGTAVVEVHVDAANLHPRRRRPGAEAQHDALVRLDLDSYGVRLRLHRGLPPKR